MVTRNDGQIETSLETRMSTLRKSFAIALVIAMSGTMAHAEPKLAAKDIVIVHGALVDASGWRAVHEQEVYLALDRYATQFALIVPGAAAPGMARRSQRREHDASVLGQPFSF